MRKGPPVEDLPMSNRLLRHTPWMSRRGFTLIELLVVIAILGILAGTFASSTSSARESARIAKATAEARELGNAIRLYGLTMIDTSDDDTDGGTPLEDIGLREGLNEASPELTRSLTLPNERNGNTVYYRASETAIRKDRLCDPWGNPYRIRLRKAAGSQRDEDDYTIYVPVSGRHRALEPLSN